MSTPPEPLLTAEEAARYLCISPLTLGKWHRSGRYGLRSIKVGRLVRYRRSDLDAFLASRTRGDKGTAHA
jgi:excisionase family DNA binding protein